MAPEYPLPYLYRLTPPSGYEELAELELQALTGEPQALPPRDAGRMRWGRVGVDLHRAALVAECCHLLGRASGYEELLASVAKLNLDSDRFRITVRKLGAREPFDSHRVQVALADVISGRPDLRRPACELLVFAGEGEWLLGELVSRSGRGWRGHEQRPHQYSIALPPRLARALVNLVARPGDRLLDPCCGVGTVLIEAADMGVSATGWEINWRIAKHARGNICHWKVEAEVRVGDGRAAEGRYDGAVVDLPYGRASARVERECRDLVARAAERCRLLAVVSTEDMSAFLGDLSLRLLGLARVPKGRLVRIVHWASSDITI